MAYHNELGKKGEQLAADYLCRKGYKILARNFIFDKAEIDLIAENDSCICIIEVKTRNSTYFGDPKDFVSKTKIKLLVKAANEYAIRYDTKKEIRFDIISVICNRKAVSLEHFRNAFYHF